MADQRITDLTSVVTLSTGDLFVVTDADQGDIAKSATIDIVSNYVISQVPSSARAFGSSVNEISTWAEGNSTEIIPSSKLPASSNPDLSNYVTLDTTQTVTGIKNFTNFRVNSQEVVTLGNDQTITGDKDFTNITVNGSTIPTLDSINVWTNGNVFTNSSGISTPAVVTDLIRTATGGTLRFFTASNQFSMNQFRVFINSNQTDIDFLVRKHVTGDAINYDAGTDTLSTEAANLVGIAGSETGTWTPVFVNGGTEGTATATYSRAGNIVNLNVVAPVDVGVASTYYITTTSLPFQLSNTDLIPSGTFFIGTTLFGAAALINGLGIVFIKPDRSITNGDEISSNTTFSLTYETND